MPSNGMEPERCRRMKAAIEKAIREGFAPYRQTGGKGSCITEAVRALKEMGYDETPNRLQGFVRTQERRKKLGKDHFLPDWSLYSAPGTAAGSIRRGKIERWILTAAQDDTDIHPRFWANLRAFAQYLGAQLHVAGFTYQKIRHTDRLTLTGTFRPEIRDYLRFDPLECGPVMFYANMNTLPTAVSPLSGIETHSQGKDAVFPHAKLAYKTVPQMPGAYVPSIMTTGAVTIPNYIQKKAGIKAEFHHILGAVIVEVDGSGAAWCRTISATPDGSFQELDLKVRDGRVTTGHRLAAVTFGDIHLPSVEAQVFDALWGGHDDSLIEALRPDYAFYHDLISFETFSRHVDGDPLHRAKMVRKALSSMEGQIQYATGFLEETRRDFCRSVVIESNHDDRLLQWARKTIDRNDTENVSFWHRCNLAYHDAIEAGDETFNLLRWALRRASPRDLEGIDFVPMGASFQICRDSGGIECGMHGHKGPNGSRGTASGLAKMATRITIGDKHSPEIIDGVYVAGITGALDQGYNTGPGSWRRAHVLTYPNGKRTIVTQSEDGRWRA